MPFRPTKVSEEFVLAKCDYFQKIGLWRPEARLDPRGWLKNFPDADERAYAVSLLNALIYLSDPIVDELMAGAIQTLSRTMFANRPDRAAAWADFAERALFAPVQDRPQDPSESGNDCLRRCRMRLGIPEERRKYPEFAAQAALADPTTPVVFVDDFVGSGRQMRDFWHRKLVLAGHGMMTLAEVAAESGATMVYAPALCTAYGRRELAEHCPALWVNPGNEISDQHGALHADSILWPEEQRADAARFVEAASLRAGIPADDWRGLADLGLTIGIGRRPPDATLPLLTWKTDEWRPLMEVV